LAGHIWRASGLSLCSAFSSRYRIARRGGPRSTLQLQSLMCSTIVLATKVALGLGQRPKTPADLEAERKPNVARSCPKGNFRKLNRAEMIRSKRAGGVRLLPSHRVSG
jgi:hypothetical protein